MSDIENTSTLLPTASVGVFVRNKKLQDDIQTLMEDWRFPRVHIDVMEGGVETAIELYKSQSIHDLILIETETIDDSFSSRLEELSAFCTEDTAAIVVGPVNDVNLYRKLTSMGVSDYLVHPIDKKVLGNVIAASLLERLGSSKSKLVTVMGAKGGVGTSSIAQALALGSSEQLEHKTVLFDAAGGLSYLSVALGREPVTTLKEASRAALAEDEESMKRMLVKVNDKLDFLASGGEPLLEDPIQVEAFENILDSLMNSFPVVIFDASAASIAIKRMVLSRSHKIYLVTTPTLSSLRPARTLIQEINTLRGEEEEPDFIDLVLNMKGQYPKQEVSKSEAEKAFERKITHVIDFEPNLFPAAEIDGLKITELKNSSAVIGKLLESTSTLLGTKKSQNISETTTVGIFDRFLGKGKR